MLQQILRDMWVDPEILAELDETQKQTLFCKMREEQVRRWQLWDQKVGSKEDIDSSGDKFQKNGKKQVQFLKGEDGEPWVWVMGEHRDDKSIENILAEEARQRALTQARQEAHQLRKSVEKELTQLIDYKPLDSLEEKFDLSLKSIDSMEDNLDMYCTVEDLRQRIQALEPEVKIEQSDSDEKSFCTDDMSLDPKKNSLHFNFIEGKRDALQDLVIPGGDGVSHRVAAWERRVAAARASDILRSLRARRARTLRDANLQASEDDAAWREQERKAKEAEATMRQIAARAREAHRLSVPDSDVQEKPLSREAVLEWFRNHELTRGVGLDENNKPVEWFHGMISRTQAEATLATRAAGTFLVRVSSSVPGYALSVRARTGSRHYRVTSDPYRLAGSSEAHRTLADLIAYHKTVPLTEHGDLLTSPCRPDAPPIL